MYQDERYVHINTCILYSQVVMYFLLQKPYRQKIPGDFFARFLELKVDFGSDLSFFL